MEHPTKTYEYEHASPESEALSLEIERVAKRLEDEGHTLALAESDEFFIGFIVEGPRGSMKFVETRHVSGATFRTKLLDLSTELH